MKKNKDVTAETEEVPAVLPPHKKPKPAKTKRSGKSAANEGPDLYSMHHNSRFVLNPLDLKNFPGEAI